jgi:hypothetical protein
MGDEVQTPSWKEGKAEGKARRVKARQSEGNAIGNAKVQAGTSTT